MTLILGMNSALLAMRRFQPGSTSISLAWSLLTFATDNQRAMLERQGNQHHLSDPSRSRQSIEHLIAALDFKASEKLFQNRMPDASLHSYNSPLIWHWKSRHEVSLPFNTQLQICRKIALAMMTSIAHPVHVPSMGLCAAIHLMLTAALL